jgi:hypothetical protein
MAGHSGGTGGIWGYQDWIGANSKDLGIKLGDYLTGASAQRRSTESATARMGSDRGPRFFATTRSGASFRGQGPTQNRANQKGLLGRSKIFPRPDLARTGLPIGKTRRGKPEIRPAGGPSVSMLYAQAIISVFDPTPDSALTSTRAKPAARNSVRWVASSSKCSPCRVWLAPVHTAHFSACSTRR